MRGYPNFLFAFQKPLLRSAFPKLKILLSRQQQQQQQHFIKNRQLQGVYIPTRK